MAPLLSRIIWRLMQRCWADVVFPVSAPVPSSSQPKKQTISSQLVLLGEDLLISLKWINCKRAWYGPGLIPLHGFSDQLKCPPRPKFFLRSGRNRVDLLSHESETTDKREQYDWRAKKKFGRVDQNWLHDSCEPGLLRRLGK